MAHSGRIDHCNGLQFDFDSNDAMVGLTTSVAVDNRSVSDARIRYVQSSSAY